MNDGLCVMTDFGWMRDYGRWTIAYTRCMVDDGWWVTDCWW